MNIKALRIFSSIIELGTLTKAADKHHLCASAASRQISILEDELGFKLFSREKRSLRLTAKGDLYYKEVQRILYSLEEMPQIAESIRKSSGSSLRLVVIPRLVRHIISPAIVKMHREMPTLKINVDVQAMRYLERWVAGLQFHLGVGRLPAEHSSIMIRKFFSLPVVVILPKKHRLVKRTSLRLEELADEPLITTLLNQTTLGRNTTTLFDAIGISPQPAIEVATAFHACSIVATGFGYTIADPLAAHDIGFDNVSIVPLDTNFRFEFAFFEPKNAVLAEPTIRFIALVEQVTGEYMKRYGF